MTDETPIPEDDAVAAAAQRALRKLADGAPAELTPWAAVETRARRVRQQRVAAVGAACAVVLVVAGALVAIANGSGDQPARIAERSTSSTSTTTDPTTTTETPTTAIVAPPATSANPQPTTPDISPPTFPPGFEDLFRGDAPQVGDVSGTITLAIEEPANLHPLDPGSEVAVGSRIEVSAFIRNITDRRIIAGCACKPTSYALVCTSSSSGNQSLWWMTNSPMEPGATNGRGGTIMTGDAYLGKVTCELDVVTTDSQGTDFDIDAGGDAATATIVGRVALVEPITFTVTAVPASTTTTTTTTPAATTTSAPPTPTT